MRLCESEAYLVKIDVFFNVIETKICFVFEQKKEYLQSLREWIKPAEKFQELLKQIKENDVIQVNVCLVFCED